MGNTTSLTDGGGANVTGSVREIGSGAATFAELERDSKSATRWTRFRTAALSLRSWTTPMIKKINGARKTSAPRVQPKNSLSFTIRWENR